MGPDTHYTFKLPKISCPYGQRPAMEPIRQPLKFVIEPDLLTGRRFRWGICEGDRIELRSPCAYETREEAEFAARTALRGLRRWADSIGVAAAE
jgi:hypothetical protein